MRSGWARFFGLAWGVFSGRGADFFDGPGGWFLTGVWARFFWGVVCFFWAGWRSESGAQRRVGTRGAGCGDPGRGGFLGRVAGCRGTRFWRGFGTFSGRPVGAFGGGFKQKV